MSQGGGGSRVPWVLGSCLAALFVAIPVGVVLASVFRSSDGEWSHLAQTRLGLYASNTAILALSVCALAAVFGISTAWLVTMHRFPGRRLLSWALLLPLAVPAYLSAYALTDLLQFSGPLQTWMRETFNLQAGEYWFPDMRTLGGAITVLAFALYPYVYFAARIAFLEQSRSALEASRTLGRGPFRTFLTVAIPLARPALIGGLLLVLMETVADFGAVDYCAVDTFATGIYRTWFGLESQIAASQLSALLLSVLFLVIGVEWMLRRSNRYHRTAVRCSQPQATRLGPVAGLLAMFLCLVPVTIGFLLPAGRLLDLALFQGDSRASEVLAELVWTSAMLGIIAAVIALILAMVLGYARRIRPNALTGLASGISRSGYAIPGPVIAIGVLVSLGWADHRINDVSTSMFGDEARTGLIFTGSILALIIGYQTRFLAVSLSFVESSLLRIHRNLDDAARTLGVGPAKAFLGIHLPLIRTGLIAGGLLVFVDVVKELPMTLMLRPFNLDTLAVRVYQLASDERLEEASTAALAIILVGFIPVILLSRLIERNRKSHQLKELR
ncbi:MAG: iron ABC transporter permease [Phycisphaerae bacterium]|nr:iron ABC transporter permease [Phycisphaerae bacterium]